MAREIHVTPADNGETTQNPPPQRSAAEPSLGKLFKELAQESSTLIQQEMALAKAEMRENFKHLAKDAVLLAIGGGLLMVGLLVLTAFLVALLGDILGDEYWLGALIVGAVFALIGGIVLAKGKSNLQHDELKPDQTIQTLKDDKRWAQAEAKQVKRDLT
jgi:uncharacterized membrane protein YqjE